MQVKTITQQVFETLKGRVEPITTSKILNYLGIEESKKSRQQINCTISALKNLRGVPIIAKASKKGRGKQYQISTKTVPNIKFKKAYNITHFSNKPIKTEDIPMFKKPRRNKMKEFVDSLRIKEGVLQKSHGKDSPGDGGDQTIERKQETMRQKEISEDKVKPVKDLRIYENLCRHFVCSTNGRVSSIQVANYYNLTNEEGARLLNRVSKRFKDVKLTVFAQASS